MTAAGLLGDRVALLTGTGEIGRAVAVELTAHGANVIAWDRDPVALAAREREVGDAGGKAEVAIVDVTDPQQVTNAADDAVDRAGHVDILVNSAAVLGPVSPVLQTSDAAWRAVIDVNLTGVFTCCRAVLRHMVVRGSGSIINVSSIGGLRGEPDIAAYCASKFAVVGFSQALAHEVGPAGVRVNCVCPGAVDSRMNTELLEAAAAAKNTDSKEVFDAVIAATALQRLAGPRDIARAIVFLASDLASFITAQSLAVDGGLR